MSTTTAKDTACQYSGVDKRRGIVFQISAGRIDIGASISFLSQYPGESEFLMQPLSCLEASPLHSPLACLRCCYRDLQQASIHATACVYNVHTHKKKQSHILMLR